MGKKTKKQQKVYEVQTDSDSQQLTSNIKQKKNIILLLIAVFIFFLIFLFDSFLIYNHYEKEIQPNSNDLNKIQHNEAIQNDNLNKTVGSRINIHGLNGSLTRVIQRIDRSKQKLHYTQGLVYANQSTLFESEGLYGQSSVHSIDMSQPEIIKITTKNANKYFGEGCDVIDGQLYQLTWRENIIFRYNTMNLSFISKQIAPLQLSEGWGITHREINNETQILLSDGSNKIYIAHQNLSIFQVVSLFYPDGEKVKNLNELEYANGILYANVYLQSYIVAIDLDKQEIIKVYDLSELKDQVIQTKGFASYRQKIENCLNGIAYHIQNNSFLVTGKLWPYFWEVQFE